MNIVYHYSYIIIDNFSEQLSYTPVYAVAKNVTVACMCQTKDVRKLCNPQSW